MSDLVLVPTARLVPAELQAEFGAIPPALIPLGGKPAFRHLADAARKRNARVVLAAHEGIEVLLERMAMHERKDRVDIIDVGETKSLGETILCALEQLDLDGSQRLVINFADTIVSEIPAGDFVSARPQANSFRWTTFESADGRIERITEKQASKVGASTQAFVGVFGFSDPARLRKELRRALSSETGADPFYVALEHYSRKRPTSVHEPDVWHDFGHIDTYYATRQQFFLNKRFFNHVEVDSRRGVVRKRSEETNKFLNEIAWYGSLPPELAHLAPRIFAQSSEPGDTFLDMEFYGYPPLAEAYLHGGWDAGVWEQVFTALRRTVEELHGTTADSDPRLLEQMYEAKTLDRLAGIDLDAFAPLTGETATINGAKVLGLRGATDLLKRVAEAANLYDRSSFGVVHGDLCLSNILFDRRTSVVRLIDPRGSFGDVVGIYGDPLYDLAKLSHSVNGDYDHIVNDMFEMAASETGVFLKPFCTNQQHGTKVHFDRWLHDMTGADYVKVRLIESLLFLSMIPLHADRPRAQLAFMAQGLRIFTLVARRLGVWHPRSATGAEVPVTMP